MTDTITNEQLQHYKKILESFPVALFVTLGTDKAFRSRPMAVAEIDQGDGTIWFFTADDSPKATEIQRDPRSAVVAMNGSTMLSISGASDLIQEDKKINALWKESYRVWFPLGVAEPHIALIRFEPSQAEYWDSSGVAGLKYFFQSLVAVATETTPKIDDSAQHGRVSF